MKFKQPVSVLVVVHTPRFEVALLERVGHPGFWQSVTGSQEAGESLRATAVREVREETGIAIDGDALLDWRLSNRFEIFQQWRHRYAPGVTHNVEHVFSHCLETAMSLQPSPLEHSGYCWLPQAAAAGKCFSWTNRDAILMLPTVLALLRQA